MIALNETLFAFQTTEMYDIIMCFIDKEKKHGRISKVYAEIFDVILKDMSASNMNEILKMLHENTSIKDDIIKEKLKINLQQYDTTKVRDLFYKVYQKV